MNSVSVSAAEESGANRVSETIRDDMRMFQRRVLTFLLGPLLLSVPWLPFGLLFGRHFLERAKGPTFETQIDNSFRNAVTQEYDMLFLGNSRIYRGLNPDRFAVPAYNFGNNDDTYNHVYYKLNWLREQGVSFRYLVLGVDFFQFSYMSRHRNQAYSKYFGDEYLADYTPQPWADLGLKIRLLIRGLNPKYMFMPNDGRTFQRDNGQYVKPGTASPTDTAIRSAKRLPVQVAYFEKVLDDCRRHNVQVFLCMLPVRTEDLNCYRKGETEEFMKFIRGYVRDSVALIDYTYDDNYNIADFTDISHFNEAAAERFSVELNAELLTLMNNDNRQKNGVVRTVSSTNSSDSDPNARR
ncbi:MAG: hypothetical protein KDA89_13930 [Planctomycetaceae bacterium]|nr:hypothetical protein [Planctomycetaceae bacterium]